MILYIMLLLLTINIFSLHVAEATDTANLTAVPDEDLHTDVIVGGAGYAGISAAKFLAKNSEVEFYIAEASDRIGGRMYEVPFGRKRVHVVETGASWIDGLKGNPVWNVAKRAGLKGAIQDFTATMYDGNGRERNEETNYEKGSFCWKANEAVAGAERLGLKCLQLSSDDSLSRGRKALCNKIHYGFTPKDGDDVSVRDLETAFNGFSPPKESDPGMARACEVFHHDFDTGLEPSFSSGNNSAPTWTYVDFDSNDFLVCDLRGFSWLVKSEAAQFLSTSFKTRSKLLFDDHRLKLLTKVTQIRWDPTGQEKVNITVCETKKTSPSNSPNLYPCKGGREATYSISANEFISTFSVAVLKKSIEEEENNIPVEESKNVAPRFLPKLSTSAPELVNALKQRKLGNYCKIFFQFSIKFWPDREYFVSGYSDGVFVGDFAPVWQSLDSTNSKAYYPGSKILVVYLTGQRAVEAGEQTDEETIGQLLPILNKMFYDNLIRLKGHVLTKSDVLDFYMTRWPQDPLFRGGFSAEALGATTEMMHLVGIRHGNVIFSGEHTCRRFMGYTHGAKLAGERSARMLLNERYHLRSIDTFSICD